MNDAINNALGWMIIAFGAAIAFLNVRFYMRCRTSWRWVKILYGAIGAMYAVFYLAYMLNVIPAAMPYTRSLTTITLAVLLSGSIVSERSRSGGCNDCP